MRTRFSAAVVAAFACVLLLAAGSAHDESATPTMVPGASRIDLTQTGPLPAIPAGSIAALRRITIAPGAALDLSYRGPTLYSVEQGTLGVDLDRHQLTFVRSGDAGGKRGIGIGRHGEVPAGVGVYAVDGDLGPARNAGDDDLVILALLIVPQPGGTDREESGGMATAVARP